MALESKLDLKLTQKFILTPQLQQAIKLLHLPQLELSQAINQELIENPMLEEISEETEEEDISKDEAEISEQEQIQDIIGPEDTEAPLEQLMSFAVDEYFEERASDGRDLGYFSPDTVKQISFEQFTSKVPDLQDYLFWQLRLSGVQENMKKVGEIVVGYLDDNGFLSAPDEEIAASENINIDILRESIKLVQGFDPSGVAARNQKECFALQLAGLNLSDSLAEKIIMESFENLGRKKYHEIAKQHNCCLADVMVAVKIIETLSPKPAVNLSSLNTVYVVPDVFVVKSDEGYRIILNDEGLPKLRINSYYKSLLRAKNEIMKEEKTFLEDKLRSAVWLIKSLEQRERTIYRVTESILGFQREFFDIGHQALKPLNLRDIAENISMHESTISRVTSTKYLSCSHGVFSFRYFFSSALQSGGGEISSTTVKDLIRKAIEDENERVPLSDQSIVDLLKKENIMIARRTVAKYREVLKLPSQNKRRRRT